MLQKIRAALDELAAGGHSIKLHTAATVQVVGAHEGLLDGAADDGCTVVLHDQCDTIFAKVASNALLLLIGAVHTFVHVVADTVVEDSGILNQKAEGLLDAGHGHDCRSVDVNDAAHIRAGGINTTVDDVSGLLDGVKDKVVLTNLGEVHTTRGNEVGGGVYRARD